jgi:hypothetical protein
VTVDRRLQWMTSQPRRRHPDCAATPTSDVCSKQYGGLIKQIWLIGSRANGSAEVASNWDFIAFANKELLNLLSAGTALNWPDVDLLVVYDRAGDQFRKPWKDANGEKHGSLSSWDWQKTSPTTATYRATKPRGGGDDFNVEVTTGYASRVYPSVRLQQSDAFTCTITEAIAWLAYGDEALARRYGSTLYANADTGWRQRVRDLSYGHSIVQSGLPGTEALRGLAGGALTTAVKDWEASDDARWKVGQDALTHVLRHGAVRSYRRGDVPTGFWADCTALEYERAGYRVDRGDMRRLMEERGGRLADPRTGDTGPSRVVRPTEPFDVEKAARVLAGLKLGKVLTHRPNDKEGATALRPYFATTPRDPVRKAITRVWGDGKRGPRKAAK